MPVMFAIKALMRVKKKENILHSWKNLELTGQIHACKKNPHKIIITGKQ